MGRADLLPKKSDFVNWIPVIVQMSGSRKLRRQNAVPGRLVKLSRRRCPSKPQCAKIIWFWSTVTGVQKLSVFSVVGSLCRQGFRHARFRPPSRQRCRQVLNIDGQSGH